MEFCRNARETRWMFQIDSSQSGRFGKKVQSALRHRHRCLEDVLTRSQRIVRGQHADVFEGRLGDLGRANQQESAEGDVEREQRDRSGPDAQDRPWCGQGERV